MQTPVSCTGPGCCSSSYLHCASYPCPNERSEKGESHCPGQTVYQYLSADTCHFQRTSITQVREFLDQACGWWCLGLKWQTNKIMTLWLAHSLFAVEEFLKFLKGLASEEERKLI